MYFALVLFLGLMISSLSQAGTAWHSVSADSKINEYGGSAFELNDSRVCIFFEDVHSFESQPEITSLLLSCQNSKKQFGKAQSWQPQFLGPMVSVGNPRPLKINSHWWIYFNAWDGKKGYWGRFLFDEQQSNPRVEWLESPEGLEGQYRSWIFPLLTPDGKVMLTYERRKSLNPPVGELRFAHSADGRVFKNSYVVAEKAQMIRAGFFKTGMWAFVYQVGNVSQMMDYLIFSKDQGKTFTAPLAVTEQSNVHDPILLQRKDGDIDVYYVAWQKGEGFVLFRRSVNEKYQLGPEERLSAIGYSVDKPHALRLQDGRIFVVTGKVNATESSVDTDLIFTILESDALLD